MPPTLVDGVEIYYESHGDGVPLVLTYCVGGNAGMWSEQIPAFAARYRCIVWDTRGHGGSQSPADPESYSVDRSADDLCGVLDHLGIDRAYIGGLSMGGGVAARFAVRYPERVKALMIFDSNTASGLPTPPAMRTYREQAIALCEAGDMDALADYVVEANPNYHVVGGPSSAQYARVRQMILSLNPIGFAHTMRALLRNDFPPERLAAITAPTLLIAGEHDPALEPMRVIHRHMPQAQFVCIPEAGHLANLDQPERFQQAVLDFLQRVEAGAAGRL